MASNHQGSAPKRDDFPNPRNGRGEEEGQGGNRDWEEEDAHQRMAMPAAVAVTAGEEIL